MLRILSPHTDLDFARQADSLAHTCYNKMYSHIYKIDTDTAYVQTNMANMDVIVFHTDDNIVHGMIMIEYIDDTAIFHRFCADGTQKGIGFGILLPFAEEKARSKGCVNALVHVVKHESTQKLRDKYVEHGYVTVCEISCKLTDSSCNECIDQTIFQKKLHAKK